MRDLSIEPWDYMRIVQQCANQVGIPVESAMEFIEVLTHAAQSKSHPPKRGERVIAPMPPLIM
jgi:hypothetical protein